MSKVYISTFVAPARRLMIVGAFALLAPLANAQTAQSPSDLQARIGQLEQQIVQLTAALQPAPQAGQRGGAQPAQAGGGQRGAAPQTNAQMPGMQMSNAPTGGDAANPEGAPADSTDPKAMLDRIKMLEQRIKDLETSTVLSDPETRVKKIEVYVDKNGNIHDEPVAGAKKETTYQRERVYRRQTINEKIEEALADAADHSVQVGVDAGIVAQFSHQTKGAPGSVPNHHAYELASADLYFTAGVAQNTLFFADVVGLTGTHPGNEIPTLTLVNGYAARLETQNTINLREAWLRTELFSQRLSVTAGRLDLTNYFDHNAAANDETSQFVSDALVNNPALGLANNGVGLALVLDPKRGFNFKVGLQQTTPDPTTPPLSLSQSIYSLAELGYVARLPGMGEGNYRAWYRTDNSSAPGYNIGYGVSLDQKLGPHVTFFGRYGASDAAVKRDQFYSGGLEFAQSLAIFPGDRWGVGYAQSDLVMSDPTMSPLRKERLVEGYYNFGLTEKLNFSFHVQHFYGLQDGGANSGFLVPGVRLQASF